MLYTSVPFNIKWAARILAFTLISFILLLSIAHFRAFYHDLHVILRPFTVTFIV